MNALMLVLLGMNLIVTLFLCYVSIKLYDRERRRSQAINPHFEVLEKEVNRLERSLKDEMIHSRQEATTSQKLHREELSSGLNQMNQSLISTMESMANQQKNLLDSFAKQLTELTRMNEEKIEKVRETVEQKLSHLQEDNNKKLEAMRVTVDEKLHATLEKRLGESFQLVSERLELVHKGLGEMQHLASGVGDLKKVLSNVKTRGTLGEIQLENLLEQTLTVEQYEKNIATKKGSTERIEFAIKLPHRDHSHQQVWLPIDSKFPIEDYQKLVDAQEQGDAGRANEAMKQLETRIKREARTIRDKYIDPPNTTDFAIMFLPVEGLYAEVLRRTGLWETLQKEYKIVVTGPTTLSAFLNSLHMGFRTLAIQKHSSEVWEILGAVKTEFTKFGDILEKTKKKLQEASNNIDTAAVRSRAIERKLKNVDSLPLSEEKELFPPIDVASSE
ncbi:DNA recombination protein RmuC [Caldalkalibacillus mannanilyticus]|uniref:DNA recombination protein RmuC n=1 Tax=Caldalkalibacillus mannanilyticus TaxID=1418 RepID=UPI00046A9202|nr:DNA recombination protein RmuC [Caldalkalibacillus mannanilyticus]